VWIRKAAPSWEPCGTHGKLYVIGLGRWRLTLLRLPIVARILESVEVKQSWTERYTPNSDIFGWFSSGPTNTD
jgi:hypothetical protein